MPKPASYFLIAYEPGSWLGWSSGRDPFIPHKPGTAPPETAAEEAKVVVSKLGAIEGRVVDEYGNPIAGAEVRHWKFYTRWGPGATASLQSNWREETSAELLAPVVRFDTSTTDAEGRYRLADVPERTEVRVEVVKPGFAMKGVDSQLLPISKTVIVVPAGGLAGRLVDDGARGIGGAVISVRSWSSALTGIETRTAEDGSFSFDGLTPGNYEVQFRAEGRGQLARPMPGVAVRRRQITRLGDIIASGPVAVTGRVRDGDTGKGLAGMRVTVYLQGYYVAPATTDRRGRYSLQVLPGEATISYDTSDAFYESDFGRSRVKINVPRAGLRGVDFKFKKAQVAKGKVVDLDGKPAAGARVTIQGGFRDGVLTDARGDFRLPLPSAASGQFAGDLVIAAEDKDKENGIALKINRSKLLEGRTELKLRPGQSATVTVKDNEGRPLEGAVVEFYAQCFRASPGNVKTDAKGEGVIKGLYEGGTYNLSARLEGYDAYRDFGQSPWDRAGAVGGPEWKSAREVTMSPVPFAKCKAVNEQGGPVAEADVTLIGSERSAAISGPDGSFEIIVPPENRRMGNQQDVGLTAVSDDSSLGAILTIDRQKLIAEGATITLRPVQTLKVVVKDTEGRPLEGAEVNSYVRYTSIGIGLPPVITDASGTAILNGLFWGGSYEISAKMPGYFLLHEAWGPAVGSAEWKDTVEMVMEPMKRKQTGRVVDRDGKPVAGVEVVSMMSLVDNVKATTDADGRFTIEGLPDAEVPLRVQKGELVGTATVSKDTPDVVIRMVDMRTGR
jgi:hypothetical protein